MNEEILINEITNSLNEKNPDSKFIKDRVEKLVKILEESDYDEYELRDFDLPYLLLMEKGYYDEALMILKIVEERTNCFLNNPEVLYYVGKCYYLKHDYNKAEEYFVRAAYSDYDEDDTDMFGLLRIIREEKEKETK